MQKTYEERPQLPALYSVPYCSANFTYISYLLSDAFMWCRCFLHAKMLCFHNIHDGRWWMSKIDQSAPAHSHNGRVGHCLLIEGNTVEIGDKELLDHPKKIVC